MKTFEGYMKNLHKKYSPHAELKIEKEYELNRGWVYNDEEDPIGETNFVISEDNLKMIVNILFGPKDFDNFLCVYIPEEDGEKIYSYAKENNMIKEDLGIVLYK